MSIEYINHLYLYSQTCLFLGCIKGNGDLQMSYEDSPKLSSVGHSRPKKKARHAVTREQALQNIKEDWKIVKMKRVKDHIYQDFLQQKSFVKEIVVQNAHILRYLPDKWRDDEDVVEDAIINTGGQHPTAFRWASDRLKADLPFVNKIRAKLGESANAKRNQKTFDSFVIWVTLNVAIDTGNFSLFQSQLSILPQHREPLMKRIFDACTPLKLTGYRDIFAHLIQGDNGIQSLKRGVDESSFKLRLAQWLVEFAGADLFYEVTALLRSNKALTHDIATSIGWQLWKNPERADALGKMLLGLTFGVPEILTRVYSQAFASIIPSVSRTLDFDDLTGILQKMCAVDEIIFNIMTNTLEGFVINTFKHLPSKTLNPLLALTIEKSYNRSAQLLLANGADVNFKHNGTPMLIKAINGQHTETIHLILSDDKCNLNAVDKDGNTALIHAVPTAANHDERVTELLRRGADPNIPGQDGITATLKAIRNLDLTCIRELLNPLWGVNINYQDEDGNSILHRLAYDSQRTRRRASDVMAAAIQADVNSLFQCIMAREPDLTLTNHRGETALKFASSFWLETGSNKVIATLMSQLLVSVGCGAIWDDGLDEDGNPRHHMSMNRLDFQHLEPHTFDHSPVSVQLQEDKMNAEKTTVAPVRLQCGRVLNAGFLRHWLNEPHPGYEESANPTKNTCPYCRQEITSIELLTTEKAANWDKYEGDALKEEKSLAQELDRFEGTPQYKQYTKDVEAAKAALKAASERLNEQDRIKAEIRSSSNAIQKDLRKKRLIEKLNRLRF